MISIKPIPEILRNHILYSVLLQVGICVSFGIHKIIKYILVYKFASVNRLIQCETIFFFTLFQWAVFLSTAMYFIESKHPARNVSHWYKVCVL